MKHLKRTLREPLPSGLNINFCFQKNDDRILVDSFEDGKIFKVEIAYFELYVQRVIILPSIEISLEKRMKNEPLRYQYSHINLQTQILPGGVLQWESR